MLIALRDGDELRVVAAAGQVSAQVRVMHAPVEGSLGGEALRTHAAQRVEPGSTGLRRRGRRRSRRRPSWWCRCCSGVARSA